MQKVNKTDLNNLFNLLYKFDDHCEKHLEGHKNEFVFTRIIRLLNAHGFKG